MSPPTPNGSYSVPLRRGTGAGWAATPLALCTLIAYTSVVTNDRRILFDPEKDAANREKHGVSLALAGAVIEAASATFLDRRFDYGEDRFVTFGYVDGRLHVAVWSERDGAVRAISVRKANSKEQKRYG